MDRKTAAARRPAKFVVRAALHLLYVSMPLSCVSQARYDEFALLSQQREQADKTRIAQIQAELEAARTAMRTRDTKIAELSMSQHNAQSALDEATAMNEQLRGELARLGKDVDAVLSERGTLKKTLEEAKGRLEELRRAQVAAEARTALYRRITEQFRALVDAGQMRVEPRSGRLALLVNGDLIFDAQKSEVNGTGTRLLGEIARTFADPVPASSRRRFLVTTHMDDAPKTKRMAPSLELGSQRALSIVDKLVQLGMAPEQLAASTVGPYDPVPPVAGVNPGLGKHVVEFTIQPSVEDTVIVAETK